MLKLAEVKKLYGFGDVPNDLFNMVLGQGHGTGYSNYIYANSPIACVNKKGVVIQNCEDCPVIPESMGCIAICLKNKREYYREKTGYRGTRFVKNDRL